MAEAPRAIDGSRDLDADTHSPAMPARAGDAPDERIGNVAIVLGLVSVALSLVLGAAASWVSDDAFISFRYARNLVEGQGLVFNSGERVEGMTNLAWTLLCALGLLLGFDASDVAITLGLAAHVGVAAALALWSLAWLRLRQLDQLQEPRANISRGTRQPDQVDGRVEGRAEDLVGSPLSRWSGVLPLAALAYALHPQTAIWATGGLESSLLTLCWTLAAVLLLWPAARPKTDAHARLVAPRGRLRRREVLAASLLGLAVALRPDAIVMSAALCLWPIATWRTVPVVRRLVGALAMGVPTALVSAALVGFRWIYYGALVPNTYFAKSAHLAWWSQGACYVSSFLEQSGPLCALAIVSLAIAALTSTTPDALVGPTQRADSLPSNDAFGSPGRPRANQPHATQSGAKDSGTELRDGLDGAMVLLIGVLLYFLAIARVGGDFMYARLLAPTLPLIALILQVAIRATGCQLNREAQQLKLRLALLVGWAFVVVITRMIPTPVGTTPDTWRCGIADEWGYYSPEHQEKVQRRAAIIGELIEGLPVTVAIVGAQAQDAYLARIPVAIESETGLCDAAIARQALESRGRVGHEKQADPHYLLVERRAQLIFGQPAFERLGLDNWIPRVLVLKDGLDAYLLAWDADLVTQLRARGAQVAPFPEMLDAFLATADQLSADELRDAYLQSWWFYFRVNDDPRRAQRFASLLRSRAIDATTLAGQRPSPQASPIRGAAQRP